MIISVFSRFFNAQNKQIVGHFKHIGCEQMIQKITKTIVVGTNRFSPQTATVGWVDEHQQTDIEEFYTSDYITVQQGDVITFGQQ